MIMTPATEIVAWNLILGGTGRVAQLFLLPAMVRIQKCLKRMASSGRQCGINQRLQNMP